MESTEDSKASDLSESIDLIAFEYGWSLEYIFDLTADQLSLMLQAINKRLKQERIIFVNSIRLGAGSLMGKEGQQAYQKFVEANTDYEEQDEKTIKVATDEDLRKLGMEIN